MYTKAALASLSLYAAVRAQQAGTLTAEVHPKLSWQKCTTGGTCTTQSASVVLDANWRWLHSTSGSTNCYTGNTFDATLCPDDKTCAANCALDGADYSGTYGITTSGNALTLKFVTGANVGSRVYLMDTSDKGYQMFNLLNQEFTVDVDVSNLPCGLNGALYFSEMDADGGQAKYPTNKAGAKYGTGYCDSQCPHDVKFIAGAANSEGWTGDSNSANSGKGTYGACCNEMDIWEANSISTAYTPHPCTGNGLVKCSGTQCGDGADRYSGVCDKDGCDFNSWRMGNHTFYGPGSGFTLDTTKKMTVVTQFITTTGTATGTLKEIRRIYVQNGKIFQNSVVNVPGLAATNSLTDATCAAAKTAFGDTNEFAAQGGMAAFGKGLANGMALVLSLWDDYAVNMLWLDSNYPTDADATKPGISRGTCSTSSGVPADVEKNSPGASVTFSNIKFGDLNSTYTGTPVNGGSPPPASSLPASSAPASSAPASSAPASSVKTSAVSSSTKAATSSPAACAVAKYGQCGGNGYTGCTTCASGSTCKAVSPPYYSQCL